MNLLLRGWRALLFPALLVLAWQLVSASGWGATEWLASPAEVLAAASSQAAKGDLPRAVGASLLRDIAGFLAGAAAGLAFGALLGASPCARLFLLPSFHGIRQVSLFAWVPLISVLIGYNDYSRILIVALSVFYPVALATLEGARNVGAAHVEVGRALALGRFQLLSRVILPAALPSILSGLRLALVYAWLATVGAEFLLPSFGSHGIGETVIRGRAAFRTDIVIFGMLVIGLLGWGVGLLADRLERLAPPAHGVGNRGGTIPR